jgi:hypothetical protein
VSSPLSLSSLVEQLVDSTVMCGSSRLSKVGDKIEVDFDFFGFGGSVKVP